MNFYWNIFISMMIFVINFFMGIVFIFCVIMNYDDIFFNYFFWEIFHFFDDICIESI